MTPLIDEMRAQIHATPMEAAPVHSGWRRRRTTGLISGAALALAAIVAAVVVLVSGGSSAPPAYAAVFHTTGNGQRTVTITLREEQDIPALNARLEAEHTRIRVVPVVKGCNDPVHSVSNGEVVPGPAKTLLSPPTYMNGKLITVTSQTIDVNTIVGRTFVLPASSSGVYSFGGGVVVGSAPRCVGIGSRFNVTPS
jgi:hypothetical protein